MKRIGLLTSGGDCQALNATMRGVVKGLSANLDELEVYGFMNGYKGLIYGCLLYTSYPDAPACGAESVLLHIPLMCRDPPPHGLQ